METYIWYDTTLEKTIVCHISYYQRRPVCRRLFIDGAPVPDFTGYISWLGQSDFIVEPHKESEKRIRSMFRFPDKWDGRLLVPRMIGAVWARDLEPVT